MSDATSGDETPQPQPASAPPAEAPPVPQPVPPAPETGASDEVLAAVKGLTEIVTKLVNKDAGIPPDQTPQKRPWTQWGTR